jgi:hypothetical protein
MRPQVLALVLAVCRASFKEPRDKDRQRQVANFAQAQQADGGLEVRNFLAQRVIRRVQSPQDAGDEHRVALDRFPQLVGIGVFILGQLEDLLRRRRQHCHVADA